MKLHELAPNEGAVKEKKRVGRGIGSGHGKTCGRGHKGQKSRSGDRNLPSWFEGGQTPLHKRIPKRGFNSPNRVVYSVVNVKTLERYFSEGEEITPEKLYDRGFVRKGMPVKILGDGEITKKFTVKAHAFSSSAKEKIEKAGGTCEVIEW
ncbi:50S ribosomal protein L15 [Hydrogenobacter hydrogenophilus]|uniref:Large ribosomal subunit protein uL15 n=1 Tax=Hydrogenobacter hydrogenophilus TaxID=35835 RepID=A0A285NUA1_9AQUI|nr:50S ribosomal protein L15 [Hydrogenobacter hydrogenophilus]SNZ11466.1 LSU ribosomal protein L15P [Hydrogenobacter hydrogenophilus]